MTSANLSLLLAHQGGWDEALLIAGPIVVIAGLLVLAKRRVDAMARDRSSEAAGTDDTGSDGAADRQRDGVDVE